MKSSLRPKVGDGLVMDVAHRLTERDRSILTMLYRHRVFTTDQLAEMYFDNTNTAQHRLTTLYRLRLVDRFQPLDHRYASLPFHYVLDQLGAMVIAAERGEDLDKSRWSANKALAIGKSQRLRHLVGVNGFFSALLAESRRREDCDLSVVVGAPLRRAVRPDRPARRPRRLGGGRHQHRLLSGVRPLDRDPRAAGEKAGQLRRPTTRVGSRLLDLLCFGHPRREAGARRVLAEATVPVATAAVGPAQRPQEAIWAPMGSGERRLRLVELVAVPIPTETEARLQGVRVSTS